MVYPALPPTVSQAMASLQTREHHHLWHLFRDEGFWNSLSSAQQAANLHWKPPRFNGQGGAGVDFLGMHRAMIGDVNQLFALAADQNWPEVEGWNPIPWDPNDPDWPVPALWTGAEQWYVDAKSTTEVGTMQQIASALTDPATLQRISLDQLGSFIEGSIHNWFHLRWSAAPATADPFSLDVSNDFLGAPFSSHVNKHFWKLHGWIDDRISDWEAANSPVVADLTTAWIGPGVHHAPIPPSPSPAPMPGSPNLHGLPRFLPEGRGSFQVDRNVVSRILDL